MTTPAWQPGTLYSPGAIVKRNSAPLVTAVPILNPGFESGDVNWTKDAPWDIAVHDKNFDGTYTARCRGTVGAFRVYQTVPLAALPGQSLTTSCQIYRSSNHVTARVQIEWQDASHTSLRIDDGTLIDFSTGKWKESTVTAVAPAGTAFVRVGATATLNNNTDTIHVDAFKWNYAYSLPADALIFQATQAAAAYSAGTEPVWPTILGGTVVDGGVTWTAIDSSTVTWVAAPIMVSGSTEPTWPTAEVGDTVGDNTMVWTAISRRVEDPNCPNKPVVAIAASKIFCGDEDIIAYCATVNPLDWTTKDDAGYLPYGLQTHGANPVRAMGLYRGNLCAFNSAGFQMWQVDPDPQSMALLDSAPIGCTEPRSVQPFQNDLVFLSAIGIRNISIAGASTNLQTGQNGSQVDPLVQAKMKAGTYTPLSVFIPIFGQYWLVFGDEAFVLTINDVKKSRWSRFVLPEAITDLTLQGNYLYMRTATHKVWRLTYDQVDDDVVAGLTTSTLLDLIVGSGTFDINGYLGYAAGEPAGLTFGGLTPSTVLGVQVDYLVAYGLETLLYQSAVEIGLSQSGSPAASDAFTAIVFTDADGNERDLKRTDCVTPEGTVNTTGQRVWTWNVVEPGNTRPNIFKKPLVGESTTYYHQVVTLVTPVVSTDVPVPFYGMMHWPFLDFNAMGREKKFVGFDLISDAPEGVSVSIGYDERDRTYRTDEFLMEGETLPGKIVPIPVAGPSFDMRLIYQPSQYWEWQAAVLYIDDMRAGV